MHLSPESAAAKEFVDIPNFLPCTGRVRENEVVTFLRRASFLRGADMERLLSGSSGKSSESDASAVLHRLRSITEIFVTTSIYEWVLSWDGLRLMREQCPPFYPGTKQLHLLRLYQGSNTLFHLSVASDGSLWSGPEYHKMMLRNASVLNFNVMLDQRSSDGSSSSHLAALRGLTVLNAWIESFSQDDPCFYDAFERNPCHWAAAGRQKVLMVKSWLEGRDTTQAYPFHYALLANNPYWYDFVPDPRFLGSCLSNGRGALHLAILGDCDLNVIRRLLERDEIAVWERDRFGWPALFYAVQRSRADIVRVLCSESGRDFSSLRLTRDPFGRCVTSFGWKVSQLLRSHVEVSLPAFAWVYSDDDEIRRLFPLVENDPFVTLLNPSAFRAHMFSNPVTLARVAVSVNAVHILNYLLQFPRVREECIELANLALGNGFRLCLELIFRVLDRPTILRLMPKFQARAAQLADGLCLEFLLKWVKDRAYPDDISYVHSVVANRSSQLDWIDPEALRRASLCEDGRGWLPLHHACASGHVGFVRLLLEIAPTSLDARCTLGQTPLIKAAYGDKDSEREAVDLQRSRCECARLLLKAGSCVTLQDYRGNSALHYAFAFHQADFICLVKRHYDYDAQVFRLRNLRGQTPGSMLSSVDVTHTVWPIRP